MTAPEDSAKSVRSGYLLRAAALAAAIVLVAQLRILVDNSKYIPVTPTLILWASLVLFYFPLMRPLQNAKELRFASGMAIWFGPLGFLQSLTPQLLDTHQLSVGDVARAIAVGSICGAIVFFALAVFEVIRTMRRNPQKHYAQ
jgi:hypothetical protein